MFPRLREKRWKRRAFWLRALGLALLLVAFFLDLPAALILAVAVPGLILFLFGAITWLVRDTEPWRRG